MRLLGYARRLEGGRGYSGAFLTTVFCGGEEPSGNKLSRHNERNYRNWPGEMQAPKKPASFLRAGGTVQLSRENQFLNYKGAASFRQLEILPTEFFVDPTARPNRASRRRYYASRHTRNKIASWPQG